MRLSSTTTMIVLAFLVFGGIIAGAVLKNQLPSRYDSLAQCLSEKGVKMYGAYWCPHCAQQKDDFGSAFKHIEYIECSSPGSRSFDLCPDITGTPTWEGPDGERLSGRISPEELGEEFGCSI